MMLQPRKIISHERIADHVFVEKIKFFIVRYSNK